MVDGVSASVSLNEGSKLPELLSIGEDSVPTDLTVSVSAPSQDQEISEISLIVDGEKKSQQEQYYQEIVKRLRSELQLQKLSVSKKDVETERILVEKQQEIELLKQHVNLSHRENETLKKENNSLSQSIVDLQTKNLRLLSENRVLEEATTKTKEIVNGLEKRITELTVKHQRALNFIEKDEITFDEFERLRANQNVLLVKSQTIDRENESLRKSAEKWKKKFNKLRDQYENRLQNEVGKLRQSLQRQIQMLQSSGKEALESKLLETEQRRDKAVKEINYWRNMNEKLKSKIREYEVNGDKTRLQLEEVESKKNELVQHLSIIASTKSRLEKELNETKRKSEVSVENLKQDISEHERRTQQYQLRIQSLTKSLNEYEEAFLAIYGVDEQSNRWPPLLKIQSQHITRISRRVTQLETENSILQKQQNVLAKKIHRLENELESKEKMLSQIQERAPETVGLFRDKDTLLRELRSQINRKDLQLMEYACQVERLKRTRNQLASDLEEVLRDRTALEDVKNMLKQQKSVED
ncbi:progesterone-induced-blocking factor 1-like [Daphnia carinata]|uniref:progesterone-induced-blocking factor 1-like n=1 Tax=Daphnia carinata TaxID=120202 RepID=UPI002579E57C|nr:progesterone-induced-blocking factor 1-like [Daphnia carinata]